MVQACTMIAKAVCRTQAGAKVRGKKAEVSGRR